MKYKNLKFMSFFVIHGFMCVQAAAMEQGISKQVLSVNEALRQAIEDDNFVNVQIALASGADANWQKEPLWSAISGGKDLKIIRLLLDAGADVHAGDAAISYVAQATGMDNLGLVRLLLEYGADVNIGLLPALHRALEEPLDPRPHNFAIIQLLLQFGASASVQDQQGCTPLHYAYDLHRQNLNSAIIRHLLLQQKPNVNIASPYTGQTPLFNAVVLAVVANDHRPDLADNPVHQSVVANGFKDLQLLLDCGADVNVQDFFGWTPLMNATRFDDVQIVELLLNYGADANVQLFPTEAPDEKFEEKGNTALHFAAQNNNLNMVQLLVDHGADATIVNNNGKTPVQLATDQKVIAVLQQAQRKSAKMNKVAQAIKKNRMQNFNLKNAKK